VHLRNPYPANGEGWTPAKTKCLVLSTEEALSIAF
jgi:hypothetical protein